MTEPLTFLHPEPRVYGKTQVEGLNWSCPDCGAVVEFFTGRPIHDRWHASLGPIAVPPVCGHGRTEAHDVYDFDVRDDGTATLRRCPGESR